MDSAPPETSLGSSDTPLRVVGVAACPFPCQRGTPARVLRQMTALAHHGHDVHVVTYHFGDHEPPPDVTVHRIPVVPGYRSLSAGPTAPKLAILDPLLFLRTLQVVRRIRPDVLHAHHIEAALIAIAVRRLTGVPVVFDAHTLVSAELSHYGLPIPSGWLTRAGAAIERFATRSADHVICVSDPLRDDLLALAGPNASPHKITVVPTGNDAGDAPGEPLSRSAPPTIVYAGSLASFQGLDVLVNALELVRAEIPEARLLVITSDSPARVPVWADDPARHGVDFVAHESLEMLFRQLGSADVAVSPRSVRGGLPYKVLNYMAVGLPTVASEGSAVSLEHEQTGLVVDDADPEAFADAILRLLKDPALRARLGEAARKQADEMRWPVLARRISAIYAQLVAGRSSRVPTSMTPSGSRSAGTTERVTS